MSSLILDAQILDQWYLGFLRRTKPPSSIGGESAAFKAGELRSEYRKPWGKDAQLEGKVAAERWVERRWKGEPGELTLVEKLIKLLVGFDPSTDDLRKVILIPMNGATIRRLLSQNDALVSTSDLSAQMQDEFGDVPQCLHPFQSQNRGWGWQDALDSKHLPRDQAHWLAMMLKRPLLELTNLPADDPLIALLGLDDHADQVNWEQTYRLRRELTRQLQDSAALRNHLLSVRNQARLESEDHELEQMGAEDLVDHVLGLSPQDLCKLLKAAANPKRLKRDVVVAKGLNRMAHHLLHWVVPGREAMEATIREARDKDERVIPLPVAYETDSAVVMDHADGEIANTGRFIDEAQTLIYNSYDITSAPSRQGLGAERQTQTLRDMAIKKMALQVEGNADQYMDLFRLIFDPEKMNSVGSIGLLDERDKPRIYQKYLSDEISASIERHFFARATDWAGQNAKLKQQLLAWFADLELIQTQPNPDADTVGFLNDILWVIKHTQWSEQ